VTTEAWTYPETVRTDCRHFRGSVPCRPHKLHGVHCSDPSGAPCPHYAPVTAQILIIKLVTFQFIIFLFIQIVELL